MTGQAIVKAILAGERDPYQLAALRNWRVKASEEEIARSLEGNWQEELLFVLQQEQDGYEFCQRQVAECDQRLQQYLQQLEDRSHGVGLKKSVRNGSERKRRGMRRSSTCARNYFA
jgi:transposase